MADSPLAFPIMAHTGEDGVMLIEPGMTLRDYFAGQALAGWVSKLEGVNPEDGHYQRWSAGCCYGFADAMLAEREKGGA
jgi:hypothetical protein